MKTVLMFPIYFISAVLSAGLTLLTATQTNIVNIRSRTNPLTKSRLLHCTNHSSLDTPTPRLELFLQHASTML